MHLLSERLISLQVNGQQTLGENIADNGGVREAFQAYQLYVQTYGEEPKLPGLDEFTPEQLFYLGNANVSDIPTIQGVPLQKV